MAILAFHNVAPGLWGGANSYTPRRLAELLDFLEAKGTAFLSMGDYLKDSAARSVCLTFDDGYEMFYIHVYPLLRQRSIPAVLFIPAAYIGLPNRWDYTSALFPNPHVNPAQIKEMASTGIEIGSHGFSHQTLQNRGRRRLLMELARSKQILEDYAGRRIHYVSYPFGRFDDQVEKVALECDYEKGFSMTYFKRSPTGFTSPRYPVYRFDTPLAVSNKIEGGIGSGIEKIKGAIMNTYAGGTIFWQNLFGSHKMLT